MLLDKRQKLFVVLTGVFITALVVGDIIGPKLVEVRFGSFLAVMSVGMLPFPITFLLTDILNEFYGKRAVRFITWVGFGMAVFAITTIQAAQTLPWAGFTREPGYAGTTQVAFDNVFGNSQRILIASIIAYLVGQFSDIAVFNALKRASKNKLLWLRATGSTVVSQLIDTVVVQTIAWTGVLPTKTIISIVTTSYAVKLVVAIGLTPLVYAGHALLERRLGMRPVVLGPDGEPLPDADATNVAQAAPLGEAPE